MQIFNKRNALIGWAWMILTRRRLKRRLRLTGNGPARRRGLLASLGLAAGAAAIALYARRGHGQPASA